MWVELIGRLASQHGLEVVDVDEEAVTLQVPDGDRVAQLSLDALRRLALQANRDELIEWVKARLEETLASLHRDELGIDIRRIRALLRPPEEPGQPHWSQPMAQGRLTLLLSEDRGDQMRLLRPMEIVASGHSIAQLLEAARDNIHALSTIQQLRAHPELSCREWRARDGYDAARALVIHQLVDDPLGLLLLLPSRDRLWLIPASEPHALERALALREPAAALAHQQSRPISAEIFWQRHGKLTHLPLGPGPEGLIFLDLPPALTT